MKVNPFPSLAVALAAVALGQVPTAQDDACEGACPAACAPAAPLSAPVPLGEITELLTMPALPAVPAAFTPDDPPRLGVYIDETDVGLRVDSVIEDSLAEAAGVRSGDVLYRINGRSIAGVGDVAEALAEAGPGGEVNLTVIRDGEGIVGLSTRIARAEPEPEPDRLADGFRGGFLGVTLGETDGNGVTVVSIVPASSAWYAGLEAGDTILAIDGTDVSDPDDLVGAISSREAGAFVQIDFVRGGDRQSVRARLGQRGPTGAFGLLQEPGSSPQLRWFDPQSDGMFFFGEDGEEFEFDFEFPEELEDMRFEGRFPRFELRGPGGDARVFRWRGDSDGEDIELDVEIEELLEKARGGLDDAGSVLRLRRGPGGAADVLRGRLGPGAKSSSMKIIINGDEVTIDKDGEVETMSLEEFNASEHGDLKIFGDTSLFEWNEKGGGDAEVHVEVHEHHEAHEHDSDV